MFILALHRLRRRMSKREFKFLADEWRRTLFTFAATFFALGFVTAYAVVRNVSILVRKPGTVDLGPRLPEELKGRVPEKFATSVFRNYAVIKDGLVNIKALPVRVTRESLKQMEDLGVPSSSMTSGEDFPDGTRCVVFDLMSLPVINRKMVKSVSAEDFFRTEFELIRAQAIQKVYNSFSKELLPPKKAEGFAFLYGEAAAVWLKEQGLSDSGFSPKTVQAEASDYYMAKELKVSLKGFSALPSLKELRAQLQKGKVNPGGLLMKASFFNVESFLASDVYTKAADKDGVLKAWLDGEQKAAKASVRSLLYKVAQDTFSIVVGQVWLFPTLEENSIILDFDGAKVECKVEMREVQERI